MREQFLDPDRHVWAVVLAGGEGVRLRPLMRRLYGTQDRVLTSLRKAKLLPPWFQESDLPDDQTARRHGGARHE